MAEPSPGDQSASNLRGIFGNRTVIILGALASIATILSFVITILTLVNENAKGNEHSSDSANTSITTSRAAPDTVKPSSPDTPTGSEWSGSVEMPTDAAVDLDATPPYVDRIHPMDAANEFTYRGDRFLSFDAPAALWRDASDPSESQCVTAVSRGSYQLGTAVEVGQRYCLKIYQYSGVRYAFITIVSATSRTLSFDLVRWAVHLPDAGSDTRKDDSGHWSGWALFWWSLLAIALIGIAGFVGGFSDSIWSIPAAVLVLVLWLILVWVSMAWWAILLVVVLAVVAFLASLSFGVG